MPFLSEGFGSLELLPKLLSCMSWSNRVGDSTSGGGSSGSNIDVRDNIIDNMSSGAYKVSDDVMMFD